MGRGGRHLQFPLVETVMAKLELTLRLRLIPILRPSLRSLLVPMGIKMRSLRPLPKPMPMLSLKLLMLMQKALHPLKHQNKKSKKRRKRTKERKKPTSLFRSAPRRGGRHPQFPLVKRVMAKLQLRVRLRQTLIQNMSANLKLEAATWFRAYQRRSQCYFQCLLAKTAMLMLSMLMLRPRPGLRQIRTVMILMMLRARLVLKLRQALMQNVTSPLTNPRIWSIILFRAYRSSRIAHLKQTLAEMIAMPAKMRHHCQAKIFRQTSPLLLPPEATKNAKIRCPTEDQKPTRVTTLRRPDEPLARTQVSFKKTLLVTRDERGKTSERLPCRSPQVRTSRALPIKRKIPHVRHIDIFCTPV